MSVEEQRQLISERMPTSFEEAVRVLTTVGVQHCFHSSFRELLDQCEGPLDFMNLLASLAAMKNSKKYPTAKLHFADGSVKSKAKFLIARAKELLTLFHAKGWVLFPFTFKRTGRGVKEAPNDRYACPSQMALLTDCINRTGYYHRGPFAGGILLRIDTLLHASTIKVIGDISNDFLQAFDETMLARRDELGVFSRYNLEEQPDEDIDLALEGHKVRYAWDGEHSTLSLWKQVIKTLKAQYELVYPDTPLTYVPIIRAGPEVAGRTIDTKWIVEANPKLERWAEVIDSYLNRKRANEVKTDATERMRLNRWVSYLLKLSKPPLGPEEVIRERYIFDEQEIAHTYWQDLNDDENLLPATRNRYLKTLHDIFFWYGKKLQRESSPNWHEYSNPINWEADRWRNEENPYETHRPALNIQIVELMKKLITEKDFALCRDREKFPTDYVTIYDRELKQTREVWYPGRAVLLLLMLYFPLRSFQARWLDSGEGDDLVVKITIDPDTARQHLELVKNSDPRAISKRKASVFRLEQTTLGEQVLAIYVSTNKTGDFVAQGRRKGYTISWCPDEVRDVLIMMREWLQRYGFYINKPIEAVENGRKDRRHEARDYAHKVEVFPLFRDPVRRNSPQPVSRERLEKFYFEILFEAQEIILKHNPQLKPFIVRKIKERGKEGKKRESKQQLRTHIIYETEHDLHSLRVTGISNLAEAGVPIEFISKVMAGHSTIFMTIYYSKIDPRKIREHLEQANEYAKTRVAAGYRGEWLFSRRDGENFKALQWSSSDADGTWKVYIDGICPGTSCSEGGPLVGKNKTPTPVPQSRCPLCRFWLTGPKFLAGLEIEMNRLFHRIHRDEQKIKALNEEKTRLEIKRDKGDLSVQGQLNVLNGQLNKKYDERSYDLQEMSARKIWMDAVSALLESEQEKALITANDEQGVKLIIQQGHYIHLLHRQSLATEIVVGFRNDEAVMELKNLLETMLALNGRISPLVRLDTATQLRCINLLTDFLVEAVPNDEEIQHLLLGEATIDQLYFPDNKTLGEKLDALCKHISDGTSLRKVPLMPQLSLKTVDTAL
jgi:hypothetical protein